MNWQTPMALAIVAATAAIILWRRLGPRRVTFGKVSGCGCGGGAGGIRPPGLLIQSRRGEPQTIEFREAGRGGGRTS